MAYAKKSNKRHFCKYISQLKESKRLIRSGDFNVDDVKRKFSFDRQDLLRNFPEFYITLKYESIKSSKKLNSSWKKVNAYYRHKELNQSIDELSNLYGMCKGRLSKYFYNEYLNNRTIRIEPIAEKRLGYKTESYWSNEDELIINFPSYRDLSDSEKQIYRRDANR